MKKVIYIIMCLCAMVSCAETVEYPAEFAVADSLAKYDEAQKALEGAGLDAGRLPVMELVIGITNPIDNLLDLYSAQAPNMIFQRIQRNNQGILIRKRK